MAQGFTVKVYGEVDQKPPYIDSLTGVTPASLATPAQVAAALHQLPAVSATYSTPQNENFPTTTVNLYPIGPNGVNMNGVMCYGVVEIPATGLNQYSRKYVVKETLATLATLRG